jgi:hypothetical protein
MDLLQTRDAATSLLGDEGLEAVALGIREGELRSGVGSLSTAEGAHAWGRPVEARSRFSSHTQAPSRSPPSLPGAGF